MKIILVGILVINCLLFSTLSEAKSYNYKNYYSRGTTHSVRSYFKRNGTFVQSHRAANPRSGIHCVHGICY